MKIAVLTEILSTHSGSRAPIELAKHLSLNNEVTLLTYDLKTEEEIQVDLEKRGVKVVLIAPYPGLFGKWRAALKFLPYLRGSDIISFHGTLPTFLVTKFSKRPIVKTYYGTQLDAYLEKLLPSQKPSLKDKLLNWFGNKLIILIEKGYFRLADQTVGISRYTANEAKRWHQKPIPFIYLGSDLAPQKNDRIEPGRSKTINILSLSRFTPYKGFHSLLKVFKGLNKEIPRLKLTIAGSVSKKEYLSYLKRIKNKNVEILTDVSNQKLIQLYQRCDVYATCDRYLFFGLPPVEAAYFGKPSVALDFAAASEIIQDDQTGYVVRNLIDFKKGLKRLIQDEKLRKALGKKAKERAQELFSWPKISHEYEKLFREIVSRKVKK